MTSAIGPILIGILLVLLGLSNRKGNINSIHWYHRSHIAEENMAAFGCLIGTGTLIIGIAIVLFGLLSILTEVTQNNLFLSIGSILVIIGCIIGLAMSLYAILKYNRGIFRFK